MANSLGTLTPTLVVQEALTFLHTQRPLLKQFTTNVSDNNGSQVAFWNQTITTRIVAPPAAVNFTAGTGTTSADVTYTDVPVTINKFRAIHVAFRPTEYNATNRDLIKEIAMPIAITMYNDIMDTLAALWVIGTYTNAALVQAAATSTYANLILPLRAQLFGRGVVGKWSLVVNSATMAALLADPVLVEWLSNANAKDTIMTGYFDNPVAGMTLTEYPALPATGNMNAFAAAPDSAVIAFRVPEDPTKVGNGAQYPGTFEYITDPVSGVTVVLNQYIDQNSLNVNYRLLYMYGVAAGQINSGQINKTA